MAYSVAKATADELACLGINWILGPVLDVLGDTRTQALGVRSTGHDPQEVARCGRSYVKGYQAGGLATCGKHFPSLGNLAYHGSTLDMPVVAESLDELRRGAFIPVRAAIEGGLDSVLVGACSMSNVDGSEVRHACLSETIVRNILRQELGFEGLIVSDCLEVESMFDSLGVGQAAVMAFQAGCNVIMVCNSADAQLEALEGLRLGIQSGIVSPRTVQQSKSKISHLKGKVTSWDRALNPGGIAGLVSLSQEHESLSRRSYEASMTVVRDRLSQLPLQIGSVSKGILLLLTPLVEPLQRDTGQLLRASSGTPENSDTTNGPTVPLHSGYLFGELTFRSLGLTLARRWVGKVYHCSYTTTGLRPSHEELIASADSVIIVTADSTRNAYQYGFTKYVAALCGGGMSQDMAARKPCVVVAVGSPYDFLRDESISTYVCTYDFSEPAMEALTRVLFGDAEARGLPPRSHRTETSPSVNTGDQKMLWLAQEFDEQRDHEGLSKLLVKALATTSMVDDDRSLSEDIARIAMQSLLIPSSPSLRIKSFVVRNSSTGVIYGFCSTCFITPLSRGCITSVVVDPCERRRSIGWSLLGRAARHLLNEVGPIQGLQLSGGIPLLLSMFKQSQTHSLTLMEKFATANGWNAVQSGSTRIMQASNLSSWKVPLELQRLVHAEKISFSCVQDVIPQDLHDHIRHCSQNASFRSGVLAQPTILSELYEIAAKDVAACNIVIVRHPNNSIVASALVYSSRSRMSAYIPTPNLRTAGVAGILTSSSCQRDLVLRAIATVAITQLKAKAFHAVSIVLDDNLGTGEALKSLGFEEVANYPTI